MVVSWIGAQTPFRGPSVEHDRMGGLGSVGSACITSAWSFPVENSGLAKPFARGWWWGEGTVGND